MFAQVIEGRINRDGAASFRALMDDWKRDLAPGADGWLGATGGVTEDGRFISVVRFESAEHAQRNSDRPEQGEWWSRMAALIDGEATFRDSADVELEGDGEPGGAGFVQVIKGNVSDPQAMKQTWEQHKDALEQLRPEILGTLWVGHGGGDYTMVVWFSSEAEARSGESRPLPPELAEAMAEMGRFETREPEFFDLQEPVVS